MSKERRKDTRLGISIPVKVRGHAKEGPWEELTSSDDASFGGASFVLSRHVPLGHCVHLDLPLPKTFRRYALSEPAYRIFALVRSVAVQEDGRFRVGVMFFGKNPPRGYQENPTTLFLLPSDKTAPRDRRQHRRFDIPVNLRLKRLDDSGGDVAEEQTVAENFSKGGARVLTSLALAKGDVVVVEEMEGDFRTRAEIRNVFIGKDNIPRLNLRFIDGEAPVRLVSQG